VLGEKPFSTERAEIKLAIPSSIPYLQN